MAGDSLRGARLGSASFEEATGVTLSPRQTTEYLCSNQHITSVIFAADAEVPSNWDCLRNPSQAEQPEPETKVARTHLEILLERRTREDLEILLKEVLADLKLRRKNAS
ncbi:MAG: hypothetical protein EBT82_00365 [Micrococcales bacterium]|nr:hypothetical protein [Micrococcales bacterium]